MAVSDIARAAATREVDVAFNPSRVGETSQGLTPVKCHGLHLHVQKKKKNEERKITLKAQSLIHDTYLTNSPTPAL